MCQDVHAAVRSLLVPYPGSDNNQLVTPQTCSICSHGVSSSLTKPQNCLQPLSPARSYRLSRPSTLVSASRTKCGTKLISELIDTNPLSATLNSCEDAGAKTNKTTTTKRHNKTRQINQVYEAKETNTRNNLIPSSQFCPLLPCSVGYPLH